MKEDEAKIESQQKQVMYVEKPDGTYGTMETGSFIVSNYIDDFMGKQMHFWQKHCEDLISNKISIIAFYQKLQELTISDISGRTGISKGKVKKHLDPKGFAKVTVEELQAYGELFDLPVGAFFQVAKDPRMLMSVPMVPTANPFITMMVPKSEGNDVK